MTRPGNCFAPLPRFRSTMWCGPGTNGPMHLPTRGLTTGRAEHNIHSKICWGGRMVAPGWSRRGKSEHHRARWFVTRTARKRGKVPQKRHRRWPAAWLAQVRLKWRGKSSPPLWRHRGQGKPHRVQDQIGRRSRAARPMPPGRSHEAPGDRRPELNDHGPAWPGTEFGLQPAPLFFAMSNVQ